MSYSTFNSDQKAIIAYIKNRHQKIKQLIDLRYDYPEFRKDRQIIYNQIEDAEYLYKLNKKLYSEIGCKINDKYYNKLIQTNQELKWLQIKHSQNSN